MRTTRAPTRAATGHRTSAVEDTRIAARTQTSEAPGPEAAAVGVILVAVEAEEAEIGEEEAGEGEWGRERGKKEKEETVSASILCRGSVIG